MRPIMNCYKEFIELFKKDISLLDEISRKNYDERKEYIHKVGELYLKILGFYNSELLSEFRSKTEPAMKKMLINNQQRLEAITQENLKDQRPYIDEFIGNFNLYYGIISGNLISQEIKQSVTFKIEEE